jgi:hypothetical protein
MQIVAMGGWPVGSETPNSPAALSRALETGFGISVPIRDRFESLVIASSPALDGSLPLTEFLSERPVWPGRVPFLAIQVTSEGLQPLLRQALSGVERVAPYVFGMSVPETSHYLDGTIPVFVRQSEYETTPAFYEMAEGVWLDALERDWYDERLILAHLRAGKHVAIVSDELHNRPHDEQWAMLKAAWQRVGDARTRVQLCTSLPAEARDFFGD